MPTGYRLFISRLLRDWCGPPEQDLWSYGAKRLSQRAHDDQGQNQILGRTHPMEAATLLGMTLPSLGVLTGVSWQGYCARGLWRAGALGVEFLMC